jgi:hypothetical protein
MPPRYDMMFRARIKTTSSHNQLSPTSHFSNDLGLDSLDTVEVVMAIEEVRYTPDSKRILRNQEANSRIGVQH